MIQLDVTHIKVHFLTCNSQKRSSTKHNLTQINIHNLMRNSQKITKLFPTRFSNKLLFWPWRRSREASSQCQAPGIPTPTLDWCVLTQRRNGRWNRQDTAHKTQFIITCSNSLILNPMFVLTWFKTPIVPSGDWFSVYCLNKYLPKAYQMLPPGYSMHAAIIKARLSL
jgi:hypothetical protein